MKFFLLVPLVLWITIPSATAQAPDSLSGTLVIQPGAGAIAATLTYVYVPRSTEDALASLYLPRAVRLDRVVTPPGSRYAEIVDTSTYIGKLFKTLEVRFDGPMAGPVAIEVAYAGEVDLYDFSGVTLPAGWVEVSPNTVMLTPLATDFAAATVDLSVEAPPRFRLIGAGETDSPGAGRHRLRSADALRGVYFVLGEDMTVGEFAHETSVVEIASLGASDSLRARVAEMVGWTVDFYNVTFATDDPRASVTVALRPEPDWDASFAAGTNYFVTYDSGEAFFEDEAFHFGNISHEIAHFWWRGADAFGRDNWLNEARAEYCSALAVRAHYGEAAYLEKMQRHETRVQAVPDSIHLGNYERHGTHDQVMAYSAGALVFQRIHEALGDGAFYAFLAELNGRGVNDTASFIAALGKWEGTAWVEGVRRSVLGQ